MSVSAPESPQQLPLWTFALTAPFFVIAIVSSAMLGGYFTHFIIPALCFVLLLDYLVGDDFIARNIDTNKVLKQSKYWYILASWVIGAVGLIFFGIYWITFKNPTRVEFFGLSASIGVANGGTLIACHELMHRADKLSQYLARLHLAFINYTHFFTEHCLGHHKRSATFEDCGTARFGEPLQVFILRSSISGFFHSWFAEAAYRKQLYVTRGGKAENFSPLRLTNPMVWACLLPEIIFGTIYYKFGLAPALFFILQSCVAIYCIESIDYIAHYGLFRKKIGEFVSKDGFILNKYEPDAPEYTWDYNSKIVNRACLMVQHHSDHHMNATRSYQGLKYQPTALQMPASYIAMLLLASFPPLWFRIMNNRTKKHNFTNTKTAVRVYSPPSGKMVQGQTVDPHQYLKKLTPEMGLPQFLLDLGSFIVFLALEFNIIYKTILSLMAPGANMYYFIGCFVAGMTASDFLSGVVHWAFDTWGAVTTPVFGPFVKSFREHHVYPAKMCLHTFIQTNGDNAVITLILAGWSMVLLLFYLDPAGPYYNYQLWFTGSLAAWMSCTNQIHKWSHAAKPPMFVKALMASHIIMNTEHHHAHHINKNDSSYCITTGWCNPFLNLIKFFRIAEWTVTKLTGAIPRIDDSLWENLSTFKKSN